MRAIRLGIRGGTCRRILLRGIVANARSSFILNSLMFEALLFSLEDTVVSFRHIENYGLTCAETIMNGQAHDFISHHTVSESLHHDVHGLLC